MIESGRLRKSIPDNTTQITIGCGIPYIKDMRICKGKTVDGDIVFGYHFTMNGNDFVLDSNRKEHRVTSYCYDLFESNPNALTGFNV